MKLQVYQEVGTMSTLPENPGLLPYGSNVSAPAIQLPDTATFKSERGTNAARYFEERLAKLNREYEELVELSRQTQMVYDAVYNFVPRVGHIYYLYADGNQYMLSMIENWNRFECLGAYRFTSDNVWERVDD
jgi:ABC-type enterochelin transport system substrate-binding protein